MKNDEIFKYIIYSVCVLICIIALFMPYGYMIILLSIAIIYSFYRYSKRHDNSLRYLIECSDKIIDKDKQTIEIIDGEGDISLLSHKLYILNERFHSLIEDMNNEKITLKDYIDDISHQLKTPITSMQINEEILLKELKEEHQKELVNKIYIQTNHMNELVDTLLTLAKLDAGTIQYDFQPYSLIYIMNNVEDTLASLLMQSDVELIYHFDDISLICDFKWLSEAIENIIKNCIEATPYKDIDIYLESYSSSYVIKIQDHGKGIDEDDLPHLLDRFYKGKNASYQSVGIGLSLSKKIIEGHFGYLEVKNNNGALFIIHIPRLEMKKKH